MNPVTFGGRPEVSSNEHPCPNLGRVPPFAWSLSFLTLIVLDTETAAYFLTVPFVTLENGMFSQHKRSLNFNSSFKVPMKRNCWLLFYCRTFDTENAVYRFSISLLVLGL